MNQPLTLIYSLLIEAVHYEDKKPPITNDMKNDKENVNLTADQASGFFMHFNF